MRRLGLAFRTFFRILGNAALAEGVRGLLAKPESGSGSEEKRPGKKKDGPRPAARSEALTLLAALQREARFVDFLQEPIAGYDDAQIGAAVRDVHEGCRTAVERIFGLEPLRAEDEGSEVDVPSGFDPLEYRLGGEISGEPPFRGKLRHHGWRASRSDLPRWTGGSKAARVVAPAEVELSR